MEINKEYNNEALDNYMSTLLDYCIMNITSGKMSEYMRVRKLRENIASDTYIAKLEQVEENTLGV